MSRERANAAEVLQYGGYISQSTERQGQVWTGIKAKQFFVERATEKEKEEALTEKPAEQMVLSNGCQTCWHPYPPAFPH